MRPKHYFDESIQKKYFTISEVAELLNEPHTCINFWRKFFELSGWRSKSYNNRWKFTRETVAKFHIIKTLLRIDKFTLEGAKQKLQSMNL